MWVTTRKADTDHLKPMQTALGALAGLDLPATLLPLGLTRLKPAARQCIAARCPESLQQLHGSRITGSSKSNGLSGTCFSIQVMHPPF